MINSFFGLEMGKRALSYFRQGMDTAGHNIANADVEGYSRQRVEASSTTPFTEPGLARPAIPGQIGTGVKMDAITHIRSEFLDKQYQEETTLQGYWNRMEEAVDQVEMFVQEPNGEGFKIAMDNYWSALQELQKRPDDSSTRVNLVETTKNMTTFLDQLITNYDQYRTSLNEDLKLKVQEANDLIDQIASLNTTIAEIEGLGQNANDLVDQRILKVEKLSELIDCKP
ncbi:MAG: flagellar hook-associated protein FlgK, partial [Synergistales bacterium]|nr:flagellar hook-associated protein FlgK [Synergistales bacterium]